ncbi:MAG TPA: hypothetical protein VN795_06605 [Stellaceae bacterium]|nr:hypothetical protein [Stellaceae bacterium]
MAPKHNPLNLNPLQLKTLALLQHLARVPDNARPAEGPGELLVNNMSGPPHGDHFHLADAVVMTKDATGLMNRAAWVALERKGLIKATHFPQAVIMTPAGLAYDTSLAAAILHRAGGASAGH